MSIPSIFKKSISGNISSIWSKYSYPILELFILLLSFSNMFFISSSFFNITIRSAAAFLQFFSSPVISMPEFLLVLSVRLYFLSHFSTFSMSLYMVTLLTYISSAKSCMLICPLESINLLIIKYCLSSAEYGCIYILLLFMAFLSHILLC